MLCHSVSAPNRPLPSRRKAPVFLTKSHHLQALAIYFTIAAASVLFLFSEGVEASITFSSSVCSNKGSISAQTGSAVFMVSMVMQRTSGLHIQCSTFRIKFHNVGVSWLVCVLARVLSYFCFYSFSCYFLHPPEVATRPGHFIPISTQSNPGLGQVNGHLLASLISVKSI